MLLNLLVLYTFIIALFKKIDNFAKPENSTESLPTLFPNIATTPLVFSDLTFMTGMDFLSTETDDDSIENGTMDAFGALIESTTAIISEIVPELTAMLYTNLPSCIQVAVNCSKPSQFNRTMVTTLFMLNFTATILPHLNVKNNFSTSMSSPSTTAYTNETFDYNNTFTDSYDNSSTTSAFDLFNYSTTDVYEKTTATDESAMNNNTDLSELNYDQETTTAAVTDYEYEYEDDWSSSKRRRRRKKRSNQTLTDNSDYNYDDENENEKNVDVDIYTTNDDFMRTRTTMFFDEYTTANGSTDGDSFMNQTEFLWTTIASFIDNITSTELPDEMSTTYVTDLWTEYLTTLNSSLTDAYEYYDDEMKICYVTRCEFNKTGDEDTTTTPPTAFETTEKATRATTTTTTPISIVQRPVPPLMCPPPMFATAISDLLPTTTVGYGNDTRKDNLTTSNSERKICWETMFGQELVKLTVLDLVRFRIIRSF